MDAKYFTPDMGVIKTLTPQLKKIIKDMLKRNGSNSLMLVKVEGDFVYVAANPMDMMLGTARIPIEAVPESLLKEERPAYAWPGGYPIYYLTKDGGILCPTCANIPESVNAEQDDSQWFVVANDINYEDDSLYCDHCGNKIESAYGE